EESPQRNEQLPRHRDNPDAPQTLAAATKALSKPATQSTLRLVTQPTPGQLCGHPAHVSVARLGDALFPGALAALIRRRCYARQAPYLTTVLEVTPAKKCHHQQPCPIDADTFQLHQLPYLVEAGFVCSLQHGKTPRLPRRNWPH